MGLGRWAISGHTVTWLRRCTAKSHYHILRWPFHHYYHRRRYSGNVDAFAGPGVIIVAAQGWSHCSSQLFPPAVTTVPPTLIHGSPFSSPHPLSCHLLRFGSTMRRGGVSWELADPPDNEGHQQRTGTSCFITTQQQHSTRTVSTVRQQQQLCGEQ